MGRIAADGEVLIDVVEAAKIMKCTERTAWNRSRRGLLSVRKLEGSKKKWFVLAEVEGFSKVDKTAGSPKESRWPSHVGTLRRWHTNLFPELAD